MKNHKIKRKANRVQRACFNCRKRKQGCEEERPCRRCIEKGIECVEVEPKRKRGRVKTNGEASIHDSSSEGENDFQVPDYSSSPKDSVDEGYSSNVELSEHSESSFGNHQQQHHHHHDHHDVCSPPCSPEYDPDEFNPEKIFHEASRETKASHLSIYSVQGLNVALLLPFMWNSELSSLVDAASKPTFSLRDSLDQYSESESDWLSSSPPVDFISGSPSTSYNWEGSTNKDIYGFDFAFYSSALRRNSSDTPSFNYSTPSAMDLDDEMMLSSGPLPTVTTSPLSSSTAESLISGTYKDAWKLFLEHAHSSEHLRSEMHHARETWKDIMSSLRTLDWQRVQWSLQRMDPVDDIHSPGILFWSSGGRVHHANQSLCRLVGYQVEELRVENDGREKIRAHSLFHPEETVKILSRQLEAVQHPDLASYQVKTRLVSKQRQEISVSCYVFNLRDAVGLPLLTMACFVPNTA